MPEFAFSPNMIGGSSEDVEGYHGEPFTGQDGHFVGCDGFKVPRSLAEFVERYPRHIPRWVAKKLGRRATLANVDDISSEMYVHLCHVPKGRTRRNPDGTISWRAGKFYQAGFHDVIETFNPWRQHGANAARFFAFVNLCLKNKYLLILKQANQDALNHVHDLDLGTALAIPLDPDTVTPDSALIRYIQIRTAEDPSPVWDQQVYVDQYLRFVEQQDAKMACLAEAVCVADSFSEACRGLSLNRSQGHQMRKKLVRFTTMFSPVA